MFYVAPLFLIALLVWIERGAPRPRRDRGRRRAARRRAPRRAPVRAPDQPERGLRHARAAPDLVAARRRCSRSSRSRSSSLLACIGAAALFLFVPRRYALVLPALVLVYFAVSQKPIEGKHRAASLGALFAGITARIATGSTAPSAATRSVAAIWSGNTDRVRDLGERVLQPQPSARLRPGAPLARRPARDAADGRPADRADDARTAGRSRSRYVLTDSSVELDGTRRRAGRRATGCPLRDRRAAAPGLARHRPLPAGHVVGHDASYTRLDCAGRHADGRASERPGALHEAADGRRSRRREAGRAMVQLPAGGAHDVASSRCRPARPVCRSTSRSRRLPSRRS